MVVLYGLTQVRTDFNQDLFIPDGSPTDEYYQMAKKYYEVEGSPRFIVNNPELDFASEEVQYHLLDYYDKLQRCYLCDQDWIAANTLESNYMSFNLWVGEGDCPLLKKGYKGFQKIVPPDIFYRCFDVWSSDSSNRGLYWGSIAFNSDLTDESESIVVRPNSFDTMWKPYIKQDQKDRTGKIIGYKDYIKRKRIHNASIDGV